ncbi:hypothetical protein [uncultured Dokdonia sp.]|uniref:hypothetical protein n=1 Tax=uncultured Dokdonia sp. TaxID=575653 RepID=UPI002601D48C|nr:hypothetical protein [uncultured Dokdonia sp.]
MKDWELDRIYIWIRTASIIDDDRGIKFLIDKNDKLLFNLIQKNNKWSLTLNQEISVKYSKKDIEILKQKIKSLENKQHNILEFPKLSRSEIDNIQKTKLELGKRIKGKSEIDTMEFNDKIYVEPANFGVKWLNNLGIEIEELFIIGF